MVRSTVRYVKEKSSGAQEDLERRTAFGLDESGGALLRERVARERERAWYSIIENTHSLYFR